jgi:methylated-DNA-[protein]-cysteine S-methyltransferase
MLPPEMVPLRRRYSSEADMQSLAKTRFSGPTLPRTLTLEHMPSPIGTIKLVADETGTLRALDFDDYEDRMLRLLRLHYGNAGLERGPVPASIRQALQAYFDGDLAALAAIPCATAGTEFQRSVWSMLTQIPPSTTWSYGELAQRLGRPSATRAVGLANGANPIGIVVPCHRVVGTNGKLTGYGGGLHRKRWLLQHERALAADDAAGDLFALDRAGANDS